jgi:hypothetical protein
MSSASTLTADSDTTNGSWSAMAKVGTSGGTGNTNVTAGIQSKIVTAGGNQTYNPSGGSADARIALFVLKPRAALSTLVDDFASGTSVSQATDVTDPNGDLVSTSTALWWSVPPGPGASISLANGRYAANPGTTNGVEMYPRGTPLYVPDVFYCQLQADGDVENRISLLDPVSFGNWAGMRVVAGRITAGTGDPNGYNYSYSVDTSNGVWGRMT